MQMVSRLIVAIVVAWIGIVGFAPKKELYYKMEQELAKKGIVIGDENLSTSFTGITLTHPKIYYQGVPIISISKIRFWTVLVYSRLDMDNIEPMNIVKEKYPFSIVNMRATYSLLTPLEIKIHGEGDFGKVKGWVNLKQHLLHLDIVEEKNLKTLQPLLKKGEKGWYYEYRY